MISRFRDPINGRRLLADALSRQSLFRNSEPIINTLASCGEVVSFAPGELLMAEGDFGNDVYFLLSGEVVVSNQGVELARRMSGNHVGEMALIDPAARRSATVTALFETVALKVDEPSFTNLANENAFLWRGLALELAARLRERNKFVAPTKRIVILIHGIRTRAEWQEKVLPILEDSDTKVIPIRYGYLDAFRFWCPFWTRLASISQIEWKISRAIFDNKGAEVIVIAHSFGTYAISKILRDNPLINISRMILCGGIIPISFRWGEMRNLPLIVNDCGTKDIWPVLAYSATWGFGESGRFGFGSPEVVDRFSDHGHSGFFDEKFISGFWLPFVRDGSITKTSHERPTANLFWNILTVIRIAYVLCLIAISILVYAMFLVIEYFI